MRRRSLIGGLWTLLQVFYTSLVNVIVLAVLTNLIAPEQFGIVAIATVFIAIISMVSELGMRQAIIRGPAPTQRDLDSAFWSCLAISIFLAVVLILLADLIADAYSLPDLALIIRILALALPLRALYLVPTAILNRELRFRPIARRQIVAVTIGGTGAIILAFLGAGPWALVFLEAGANLVEVLILWTAVQWRPRFEFSWTAAWRLARFGVPTLLTQSVQQGRERGTELIIAGALGASALGFWVVAIRITGAAMGIISSVVNSVALPAFAQISQDEPRFRRAIRHTERVAASIALPGFCALALLSPTLVPTLFGAEWAASGWIAAITAAATGVLALQTIDTNVWWARGRPWIEFLLSSAFAVVQLVIAVFIAPLGLLSLAVALLIRSFAYVPLRAAFLVLGARIPLTTYADVPRIAITSAIMAAAMIGVHLLTRTMAAWPYLLIQAAVGLCAYLGGGLLIQRGIFRELASDVRHVLRRDQGAGPPSAERRVDGS